jgi:hypothetical protein
LGVAIQQQQKTNWCWSAVTASIAAFFDHATRWDQCAIACAVCNDPSCCGSNPSQCNQAEPLDDALLAAKHLNAYAAGAPRFEHIVSEIARSRPVATAIQWTSGGNYHFVVVDGYDAQTSYVTIRDPQGPATHRMPYSVFVSDYLSQGLCTDTYWTRP